MLSLLKKTKQWPSFIQGKLIEPNELLKNVQEIKSRGTLATLNGSFDLLHAGHLSILDQAKGEADFLLVALNSDRSIQQYKSPSRPIIPLGERLQMMASIACVDFVTYFEEIDPSSLLSIIKPDVHVNGSEYGEKCIEADIVKENGGRLHIVRLSPGFSTSSIIQKIKALQS